MLRLMTVIALLSACGNDAVTASRDESTPVALRGEGDDPQPPPAPVGSPIAIEPGGFSPVEDEQADAAGHTRYSSPPGGACMVDVHWWRPMPPRPGGPMTEASRRSVTVAGLDTHVVTTSMFEGAEREVDVVFLRGDGHQVRIVFESCGATEEDGFLAGVSLVP